MFSKEQIGLYWLTLMSDEGTNLDNCMCVVKMLEYVGQTDRSSAGSNEYPVVVNTGGKYKWKYLTENFP